MANGNDRFLPLLLRSSVISVSPVVILLGLESLRGELERRRENNSHAMRQMAAKKIGPVQPCRAILSRPW